MTPTLMVINLVAEVERLNRQNADLQAVIGTLQKDKAQAQNLGSENIARLKALLKRVYGQVESGPLGLEILEVLSSEPMITIDPRD